MKNKMTLKLLTLATICIFLLSGCSKEEASGPVVSAAAPIAAEALVLENVSVQLPDGMTRKTVSNIQHDFIQDSKQVGGIVIVDIPAEMLDSPFDHLLEIPEYLAEQLMPQEKPAKTALAGAGGSPYAYMEIYTGEEDICYFHYLFRGERYNYDVWFDYTAVSPEMMESILASVAAEDITADLNESIF